MEDKTLMEALDNFFFTQSKGTWNDDFFLNSKDISYHKTAWNADYLITVSAWETEDAT